MLRLPQQGTGDTVAIPNQEYRERLKILLIEVLAITWSKEHLLKPYKHLNNVPMSDWPGLLTMAELDTAEMIHDAEMRDAAETDRNAGQITGSGGR